MSKLGDKLFEYKFNKSYDKRLKKVSKSLNYDFLEPFENVDDAKKRWLNILQTEEYGIRPKECNVKLLYEIAEEKTFGNITGQKIFACYRNLKTSFYIFFPNNNDTPKRVFVMPLHPSAYKGKDFFNNLDAINDYCPIKKITARNFAVALIKCGEVADDDFYGKSSGIFKEMNLEEKDNGWGVISAWAWASSKVVDYIYTDKRFDNKHIAVVGHSRGGKTALLAGATDERFCLAISNNSGNSGASISRYKKGEDIKSITMRFPYWFCNNYKRYAKKEFDLPFDQHILIALIAPRKCYVASAVKDDWADPVGELVGATLASKMYNELGYKGLVVTDKIEINKSYSEGNIGYHIRSGIHEINEFDWNIHMDTLEKID